MYTLTGFTMPIPPKLQVNVRGVAWNFKKRGANVTASTAGNFVKRNHNYQLTHNFSLETGNNCYAWDKPCIHKETVTRMIALF